LNVTLVYNFASFYTPPLLTHTSSNILSANVLRKTLHNVIVLYNVGQITVINIISLLLNCYQTASKVMLMLHKPCSRLFEQLRTSVEKGIC